jgi:hypothetical protein
VNLGYGYVSASANLSVGEPSPYEVSGMPPEPLYEQMTPSPGEGFVWIDGYWHWNGYEWVWVSGRWEQQQDGYVYVQPFYDYVDGSYIYTPGYWSQPGRAPHGWITHGGRDGRPVVASPPAGWHPPPTPGHPFHPLPPAQHPAMGVQEPATQPYYPRPHPAEPYHPGVESQPRPVTGGGPILERGEEQPAYRPPTAAPSAPPQQEHPIYERPPMPVRPPMPTAPPPSAPVYQRPAPVAPPPMQHPSAPPPPAPHPAAPPAQAPAHHHS